MSTKTNSEMLKSIKQYNKTEREKRAVSEGFATAVAFIAYLEKQISSGWGKELYTKPAISLGKAPAKKKANKVTVTKTTVVTKTKTKTVAVAAAKVIHVIDVLDNSGSMTGGKANAAYKGINRGIKELKEDKNNVTYTYTLCDFSDDIRFVHVKAPLTAVEEYKGYTRGSTALYDAIGDSIAKVSPAKKDDDVVLVNIYTDGQENSSRRYNAAKIATLIEELGSLGWTFTFIGTDADVKYAQRNLKFHDSNTLIHDNTERGMESAFMTNSVSRTAYSSKVAAGEDVSKGFYKDIN